MDVSDDAGNETGTLAYAPAYFVATTGDHTLEFSYAAHPKLRSGPCTDTDMSEVTQILQAIRLGNSKAPYELLPLVYDELRRLAAHRLANERPGHTLQPTAAIHTEPLNSQIGRAHV